MKTVQQWLRQRDAEEIFRWHISKHPPKLQDLKDPDWTVGELLAIYKENYLQFIERLKSLKAVPEDQAIFYAVKQIDNGSPEVSLAMSYREDILTEDLPEQYSCLFTDFDQVISYPIADTKLGLDNIDELLEDLLYEISWFGYTQEQMEAERAKLEEAKKEAEEHPETLTGFCWGSGLQREQLDPVEDDLEHAVNNAVRAYNEYSVQREVLQVRKLLAEEEK